MTNFKKARIAKNMSQKELAITMRVAQPTVSAWESGRKTPTKENLKELCDILDVSSDYLLDRTDDPNPVKTKEKADEDEITLDDIEFALFGEVRELTEEEKEELLRNARRMNELRKYKRKNQLDDE